MTLNGSWSSNNTGGYLGGYSTSTASSANAVYTFSNLTVGEQYEVAATWTAGSSDTPSATYTLSGGGTGTATINQQTAPTADLTLQDCPWQSLITFTAGAPRSR